MPFFATIQLVMAGNDTEGVRYGAIETPEKYYLTWKEESSYRKFTGQAYYAVVPQRTIFGTDARFYCV